MTKKALIVILFVTSLLSQKPSSAPTPAPWKQLEFLIGKWEAKTQGGAAGASSSGAYSFQTELRNHVLARHTRTSGGKGPTDYNCEHGDLLYIYPEAAGQSYKAIYFDNEGHVIHYDVSTPSPTTAI